MPRPVVSGALPLESSHAHWTSSRPNSRRKAASSRSRSKAAMLAIPKCTTAWWERRGRYGEPREYEACTGDWVLSSWVTCQPGLSGSRCITRARISSVSATVCYAPPTVAPLPFQTLHVCEQPPLLPTRLAMKTILTNMTFPRARIPRQHVLLRRRRC